MKYAISEGEKRTLYDSMRETHEHKSITTNHASNSTFFDSTWILPRPQPFGRIPVISRLS